MNMEHSSSKDCGKLTNKICRRSSLGNCSVTFSSVIFAFFGYVLTLSLDKFNCELYLSWSPRIGSRKRQPESFMFGFIPRGFLSGSRFNSHFNIPSGKDSYSLLLSFWPLKIRFCFPSYKMVDLSIVFSTCLQDGNHLPSLPMVVTIMNYP